LIQRLENDLHAIKPTPQNRLRISDRTRELVRATDLLHKLEGRDRPTRKIRVGPPWPCPGPYPPVDPDMFGGVEGENVPLITPSEVLDRLFHRVCERED